ncbi:MAG: hypothetical protein MUF01_15205 [Bryobacterales bacterium]|nr:hypothetical protein [Bryobacterales bacterium]
MSTQNHGRGESTGSQNPVMQPAAENPFLAAVEERVARAITVERARAMAILTGPHSEGQTDLAIELVRQGTDETVAAGILRVASETAPKQDFPRFMRALMESDAEPDA